MKKFRVNLTMRINEIRNASLDVISGSSKEIVSANEKLTRVQLKEVDAYCTIDFLI